MDHSLVAWLPEGTESPARFPLFGIRCSGREGGGNGVLGKAKLTVPAQPGGGEVGLVKFDGCARLDGVDKESLHSPWLAGLGVLGEFFIREIGTAADTELPATTWG